MKLVGVPGRGAFSLFDKANLKVTSGASQNLLFHETTSLRRGDFCSLFCQLMEGGSEGQTSEGCNRPPPTSTVGKIRDHVKEFMGASMEDHKK